jgi:hypothetical protein
VEEDTCRDTEFSTSIFLQLQRKTRRKSIQQYSREDMKTSTAISSWCTQIIARTLNFESRRLQSSGIVRNLSCYIYAIGDIPILDNVLYLRWAYYDTLSFLVWILIAKGESAEASVWLQDIPQDFYRPGEFDFIKICDIIERFLCAGDKEGAERVGLSHLRSVLGKFELSAEETQSISA